MRESKLLKAISYCLIPILVLIIGLSVFYELGKDIYNDNIDASTYFKTDTFLNMYMNDLSSNVEKIIYYNEAYNSVYDSNIRICYTSGMSMHFINHSSYSLKDNYYLIQYKDLALTNVELTSQTDSLEEIKSYIDNIGTKKTNIINGVIDSNSEIFMQKAIQYFDNFENTYYSINKNNSNKYIVKKENSSEILMTENGSYEYNPYEYKYEITDDGVIISEIQEQEILDNALDLADEEDEKEWYTTTIKDFKIFASYNEELIELEDRFYLKMLINDLKPYETQMIYEIPIASILLVIILIYLIVAIGHTKNKEGIDFNDLDKIPIEVILAIGGTIALCIIGVCVTSIDQITAEYYNFANSLLLTGYFISYILCAVMLVTIVKRIKSKNLIKESLTGRFIIWCWKLCKKTFNKVKVLTKRVITTIKELFKNWPDAVKASILFLLYGVISIFAIVVLGFFGFMLVVIATAILIYAFIEQINSYKKIENHLNDMYNGNNAKKLDDKEFTKNFKEVVKYINDISRGYENAIEEGIKSERLKTELITNVSHDIKTPLTSIINYVDLIKKENVENEKIKEYIEVLDNKSQRLKKLTEDLVEASKASSGNVKLNIEKINVVELIKQSTGEFEDKFKSKELEIISEFSDEDLCINADNRYMYRIIENLFSNISKYAQEKSRVYIEVKRIGSKVRISVKNISKERLNISSEELMQRFVRGDKSRTTEGSGLGLSISRSLTELQKGSFEIQIDGDLFKVELEFEMI